MSPNHKNRKNSDVQVRVCMTKGIGAVKARVKLVFHSSYCPVAQEGLFSFSMFVQHEVSLFVEVLCVFLQCCVLHLLYIHQDVLLQTSASHACVCIGEQLGHLFKLSPPCYLCFARTCVTLPSRQLDAAPYKGKDNMRSIWVEGVTSEKCLAVLLPWSVSPLACAGLRCAPRQCRDPKCSDLLAAAAN